MRPGPSAISFASYLRNRSQVSGLSKTPEELWSGAVPRDPLPRLLGVVPPQNQEFTDIVSNSSGTDDHDASEDGPEWYPDDATPANHFGLADADDDDESSDRPSLPLTIFQTKQRCSSKEIRCSVCCQPGNKGENSKFCERST